MENKPAASIIPVNNTAISAAVISRCACKTASKAITAADIAAAIRERLRNTLRSLSSNGLLRDSTGANRIMSSKPVKPIAAPTGSKAREGISLEAAMTELITAMDNIKQAVRVLA